jgi:hypothetical protein
VLRLFATGLAHEVDREVGDDAVKPGEKARPALKPVEPAVDAQKCLLHEVACVVLVADHAEGDGERPALVALDQAAESRLVTPLGSLDESTIFLGFGTSNLQVGRTRARSIHVLASRLSPTWVRQPRAFPFGETAVAVLLDRDGIGAGTKGPHVGARGAYAKCPQNAIQGRIRGGIRGGPSSSSGAG